MGEMKSLARISGPSFNASAHYRTSQKERRVRKRWYHVLLVAIVAVIANAMPAAAQINSLRAKGFNYASYYNGGGYANADSLL